MTTGARRERIGRLAGARRAGVALLVALALGSPRVVVAAPPPGAEAEGGTRTLEAGLLAGLQLTSLVLHLVSGISSSQAASSPPAAVAAPVALLVLEARVWAGEEGLPPAPCAR